MNERNDRPKSDRPAPAPKKRFRVEKLEERIAPKRKIDGGGGSASGSGGSPSYTTIY